MYEWVKNESRNPYVTIYSTNITLNRSAIEFLDNPWHVMLGVNKAGKQVAIRPVTQQEVEDGLVTREECYRISIGRSYGRIANRSFCSMLDETFGLDLSTETGRKYPLSYDEAEKILVIDLGSGETE
ncbi:MAG: hypothetical protein FWE76_05910 [Symbiobacteriaceae bacterium]|nr:hypothetical protein [Symbiobacteriaceae bacterium]